LTRLSKTFLKNIKERHTVIVGMTRSGKTMLCKKMLQGLQDMNVHTIFIDPKHDDDYADLGTVCTTPMQFYSELMAKNPRIIYRPPGGKTERQEHLTRVIDLVFNAQRNQKFKRIPRVIAIDEIQLFVKKGSHDGIEKLWTVGAGLGVMGMGITQRIQLCNEVVWTQSENKALFKVEDRKEYLKSRNLQHFVDLAPFFYDPANKYWFYHTHGGAQWKKHKPVSLRTYTPDQLRLRRR
jgi:hypothetical protein